ncbi:breast cancer type 1 susceptibility protein homolog, partial [Ruditapes philippinarum]|uniref:breast cancer type 1 susceptibility protein homolog n=1 Tax=Ruditapes philippinarum TaxID=129788 RepID=UPI00295B0BD3
MAEKRVQELLGQMQKTLECSICLEMMNNPVSTGCGHQFCRFCLTEFIDRKRQVPCPLCKKPITKRSLMKREELGDMVEGVRSLISAFQKDTGFLFSPPRGPQSGLLPGTPDSIKAKTTTGQKPAKNVAHSNVRRTKRRQLIDTASTDSPSLIRRGSSPSHSVKKSINGEQDAELGSSRTLEDDRQQELLKCIQEGTLNADDSSEDNDDVGINKEGNSTSSKHKTRKRNGSKKHPDRNSSNSNISRQKIGKAESDLTDGGKETMEMNQSKVVSVSDKVSDKVTEKSNAKLKTAESIGKTVNEDIAIEVQENNDNDATNEIEMEVDTDVHILSGTSVAKESESSSGPLFRTPVDPKGLKHSHQRNSSEDQSQVRKKSLRSKDNTNQHLEADDHDSSLKMTQEDLTVKVKDNSRTYCKKDKDLFVKEKKATRKVAEWLKNIPPISDSENVGCDEIRMNEPKEKIQPKRMSKKDVKVREEEEAMGNKIKHLAKQVQDNGKGLLFEIDDFETEPEKKPPTDSKIKSDKENASISIESEKSNLDKKNYEEVSDVRVQEVKHVITEPVRRKRIFKSRTNQSDVSSESDSDKALIRNNNQNVTVMKTITEEKNTSNVLDNEIVEIRSQDSELPSSDPYEFKSSQNTPMKVTKKKGKSKNNKQSKALK